MPPMPPQQSLLMPAAELSGKVREYEQFANDVLKADLQKTVEQRARLQAEVQELEQLRRNIQQLQQQQQAGVQHMKSQVELGSGVFCRAHVPDTSHVYISIGLGFQLQVTLQEAGRVIDIKQEALQSQIGKSVDKAARIKAHLKFIAEAIRELTGLP